MNEIIISKPKYNPSCNGLESFAKQFTDQFNQVTSVDRSTEWLPKSFSFQDMAFVLSLQTLSHNSALF